MQSLLLVIDQDKNVSIIFYFSLASHIVHEQGLFSLLPNYFQNANNSHRSCVS